MYLYTFHLFYQQSSKKYIPIVPDVTGGGAKKWQFLLIYSTIYADVGGWVGLKNTKN